MANFQPVGQILIVAGIGTNEMGGTENQYLIQSDGCFNNAQQTREGLALMIAKMNEAAAVLAAKMIATPSQAELTGVQIARVILPPGTH